MSSEGIAEEQTAAVARFTVARFVSPFLRLLPPNKAAAHPIAGRLRKGKRTKELVKTLRPGDIVLIDHADIDAIAARALADRGVAAVIDAAKPTTGRYPNRGPLLLARARIPLYVLCNPAAFDAAADGAPCHITAQHRLIQFGRGPALLELWTPERIAAELCDARANLDTELDKFAANTLSYIREEKSLLLEPVRVPDLKGVRSMAGKHVVVVVRGEGYKEDLNSITGYIQDVKPVLIGVDGGADALIESGFQPDVILGDMDSVSDSALACGAHLIVHAYVRDGRAPGLARIQSLGCSAETFPVAGTSEDAALLLAHEKGAELIVAVGTHSNLEHFLDKGRAGMASTFLVRLKVGSRLVDARGVSQLHLRRVGLKEMAAVTLSAVFVLVVLLTRSPFGHMLVEAVRLWWRVTFR